MFTPLWGELAQNTNHIIRELVPNYVNVRVGGVEQGLLNEFTENQMKLYGRFPFLFFLGEGLEHRGGVSKTLLHHLLNEYDGRFVQCVDLSFLQCAVAWRCCTSVKSRLYGEDQNAINFLNLVNCPEFYREVYGAVLNPQTSRILYIVRLTGKSIPWRCY